MRAKVKKGDTSKQIKAKDKKSDTSKQIKEKDKKGDTSKQIKGQEMTPGGIIRTARKAKKLRQIDLAQAAGVHLSYICRIEKNDRNIPSYPILVKMANALDLEIGELSGSGRKSKHISLDMLIHCNAVSINGKILNQKNKAKLIDYIYNDFTL